jgi:hypothetical protein
MQLDAESKEAFHFASGARIVQLFYQKHYIYIFIMK